MAFMKLWSNVHTVVRASFHNGRHASSLKSLKSLKSFNSLNSFNSFNLLPSLNSLPSLNASTLVRHTSTWPERRIIADNVYSDGFIEAVGNTPLIRLRTASEKTGCDIWGKAEFMNPGGSVKDRAATWMIKEAEERGILKPGKQGIIVEGTAGNTGIGLTLAGNARGYKTVIVIADSQAEEKKDVLRWCGAFLLEVPAVPFKDPKNYVHIAAKLAECLRAQNKQDVFYADQWGNLSNRKAHIESTGPEIWEQLKGKVDGFGCATGTGGTLSGTAEYLRSKNPKVKIALTDPCGAGLVNYYNHGELLATGNSISEGIGQNRITGNMQGFRPDFAFEISDNESLPWLNDLLAEEGLCLGTSSGINVAGAVRLAKELGPGHTIVTILCDSGRQAAKKIYNPTFLRSRSLPVPDWLDDRNDKHSEFRGQLKQLLKQCML